MKRVSSLFLAAICLLSLVIPSIVLAANSVPAEALKTRESVYRVLCEDLEYTYSGSSFVVGADDKGTYLITNYHVIEGANLQSIAVVGRDGTELPASVVGYDTDYDLCILQTAQPIKGATAAGIEFREATVGEAVYALGFPGAGDYLLDDYAYAVEDITVTDGIISAVKTVTTGAKKTTFLQMNAAINPGSSGGPLVNGAGQVVGINTLGILEAQDVYAAVSSPHILDILRQYSVPFQSADQTQASAEPVSVQATSTWVWLVVGVCVVLGLAAALILILRSRRLTLAKLLSLRLQGYSMEEALHRLGPVFRALAQLHARGEAHGYIHPANIFVDKYGVLHLGGRRKKCVLNENTRPYTPMEQYDATTHAGTYSDVYELGGVLYAMLTCTPPPDVMSRLQHDALEERLQGIQGLPGQMREALLNAMALKKEERLHDMERFLRAVELQPQVATCLQQQEQQTEDAAYAASEQTFHTDQLPEANLPLELPQYAQNAYWHDVLGASRHRALHLDKNKRRKILVFSCGGAMLLIMASLLIINESGYRRAVACCESGDFTGAYKAVQNTFVFYRDSRTLCDFITAGLNFQAGNYQEGKNEFIALGDYRNSQEMAMECDYQKAKGLMQLGQYDDAKEIFIILATSSFRNSVMMVQEADYQKAKSIFDRYALADPKNKRYMAITESLKIFKSLDDYSDSKAMLEKVKSEIYEEALYIFNEDLNCVYLGEPTSEKINQILDKEKNLNNVKQYFSMVEDYRDSKQYIKLCDSLYPSDKEKRYRLLLMNWSFMPARNIILSDWYIDYFLLGTWRGDGHYFKIYERGDEEFYSSYDIPWINGKYYKIENLICYKGSDEDGWRKMFTFKVINEDEIEVYAHKNGRTYTLYRQ